jgi:quinol-cytochrome oxidoreductase complex cytochrome b subunit
MTKAQKILLSIPSLLILFIIPYNFFADLEGKNYNMIFNGIIVLQILYLIGLIYILFKLWKDDKKTKNTKWTWTLLMIFCMQPITTLVYLWAIESEGRKKQPAE